MGSFITDLKNSFNKGNIYIQFIYINVGVFIVTSLLGILWMLFNRNGAFVLQYLELPAWTLQFVKQPWSLLTYMFMHAGILHLLFNMLWLYWFGQMFLSLFSAKHFRGLYLLGGICGGLLYMIAYNVFPYFSTSKSAEEVAEKQDVTLGAIAGKQAAELYNLKIIAPAINSNSNNYTRFVIIAKKPEIVANANKITLIVAVKHETGSLYKMLASFYHMGLNMLNLESRPIVGKTWEYFFYIDVTGNLADPLVIDVMEEIKSKSTYCKVLGNYRAYERKE